MQFKSCQKYFIIHSATTCHFHFALKSTKLNEYRAIATTFQMHYVVRFPCPNRFKMLLTPQTTIYCAYY